MTHVRILLTLVFALSALTGPVKAQEQRLLVFAAASLKDALDEINAAYRREKGVTVVASYAGSTQLIKQIEQGAPAAVFLAADRESMDYGLQRRLLQGSPVDLLGNGLVLIAPADASLTPVDIGPRLDLAALAGNGRIVTGDVRAVPVGRYAQTALRKLGLWDAMRSKLAMVENVRLALAMVARGEAPLGIVYATDAKVEPKVKVIGTFPEDSHPPIVYPAAMTATSPASDAAPYLQFLQSATARAIFEKRGFVVLARSS